MPPRRPPKCKRPPQTQSVPSATPISNPGVGSNADIPVNHTLHSSSPPHSSTSLGSAGHDDHRRRLTPFLNTTFSTHRLSPLYVGSQPLTEDRIQALSHRLRDFLVGDVVRGVEVGLDRPAEAGAMSRAGALEAVSISWFVPDRLVGSHPGQRRQQDGPGPDPSSARGGSGDDQAGDTSRSMKGLEISLQYEHAECAALLLPSAQHGTHPLQDAAPAVEQAPSAPNPLLDFALGKCVENDPAFLHLPLLLMRMPAPLKAAIISFLSRTFDCRVSSLSLGTRSLVRALEEWAGELSAGAHIEVDKDVVLTLGFYAPTVMQCRPMQCRPRQPHRQQHQTQYMAQDKQTESGEEEGDTSEAFKSALGVKSIDVIIPGADLVRLITAGQVREAAKDAPAGQARDRLKRTNAQFRDPYVEAKRRKLGGDKDEEGWTWLKRPGMSEHSGSPPQPFTDALAQYMLQHLALDILHPAVRITKVACGGFALSEGRVKIFGQLSGVGADRGIPDAKRRAIWGVLDVLLAKSRVDTPDDKLGRKVGGLSN